MADTDDHRRGEHADDSREQRQRARRKGVSAVYHYRNSVCGVLRHLSDYALPHSKGDKRQGRIRAQRPAARLAGSSVRQPQEVPRQHLKAQTRLCIYGKDRPDARGERRDRTASAASQRLRLEHRRHLRSGFLLR